VTDPNGWTPATQLVAGDTLPRLFGLAEKRWGAAPHAAATLSWKSYTYWLCLPAMVSWATARRVPLLDPRNVLVRFSDGPALLQVGLSRLQLAVLPEDPLAGQPGVIIAGDEGVLLKMLRMTLMEHHLEPMAEKIQERVKVGRHNLRGSIASAIAYGLIRTRKALPGTPEEDIVAVLDALGLDDLVEITQEHGGPGVQRKTCCLAFTLPEPKVCSGCCIRKAPTGAA
jgi:hypothetical protein